jgi:peroxiredoxin
VPLASGASAPPAALRELSGAPARLEELFARGPALLFFHKADCPATVVAATVLPRFAAVPGLALAAVSQDEPEEARAFAAASGWGEAVRVLLDPEPWPASDAYAVRATPTWLLVARGGRVEAVTEGWSRDDANGLAARAAELAGAAPPIVSRPGGAEPALRPG